MLSFSVGVSNRRLVYFIRSVFDLTAAVHRDGRRISRVSGLSDGPMGWLVRSQSRLVARLLPRRGVSVRPLHRERALFSSGLP